MLVYILKKVDSIKQIFTTNILKTTICEVYEE